MGRIEGRGAAVRDDRHADIQTLLGEREITRGLGRFARILDQKRWADLSDVFAEDLDFEYGSGV